MKRLAVLGSTGSIGRQTLEVVRAFPEKLSIVALAAGGNVAVLEEQIREFAPKLVCCAQRAGKWPGLEDIATDHDVDLVVTATSGKVGLLPTLAALGAGKTVALANKETLVVAGDIVMAESRRHQAEIRPVDSEHSAIWQCLQGEDVGQVSEIILTTSGGPFLHRGHAEMANITVDEALRHPTWKMGRKVTIDSATLMNKGMEVIEAHWLFNIPFDRIKVVIHPGSLVHSMVKFTDGAVKAQLGVPDMRLPIQYALSYPERWPNAEIPQLDCERLGSLRFQEVDLDQWPCLRLAIEAGAAGDTYPAVLSAADEVAVDRFLSGKISFLEIPEVIESVLHRHDPTPSPSIEDLVAADTWAREAAWRWSPA